MRTDFCDNRFECKHRYCRSVREVRPALTMTRRELCDIVEHTVDCLWPDGDINHEWDADTLDHVAGLLITNGLRP